MKKVISVGIAVLMLILCMVPAFADSMTISTKASADDYQLAYPADTQIPWEAATQEIGAVQATKMLLSPGKTVAVTVTSQNEYRLVNTEDAQKTIAYTLSGADAIAFLPGDYGKAFPLSVAVAESEWRQAAAGEHLDTLTFTAEYKNA